MRVVRRLAYVRSDAGGGERTLSIGASCGALGSELVPWRPPERLRDYAARLRQALGEKMPASRAVNLEVEVGVVQVDGVTGGPREWQYAVALCDLSLVLCRSSENGRPAARSRTTWRGVWTGSAPPQAMVVLSPSATLALSLYLLDADPEDQTSPAQLGGLRLRHTQSSCYPPHHHPWNADGSSHDDPRSSDLSYQLFARLDNWATPLTSLYGVRRGNVEILDSRPVAKPSGAHILVEGVEALGAPSSEPVAWRCAWSYVDEAGHQWSGGPELVLRFDAKALLSETSGPVGKGQPACRRDPIEGDGWGRAPGLIARVAVGELL